MVIQIQADYNFNDVLDAFPIVGKTLRDDLHFSLKDVRAEETLSSYFTRKSLKPEEIVLILRKVNHKLTRFMTKEEPMPIIHESAREVFLYDAESEEEEE